MLQGKKILLGVCGSIAAYKAAFLTRLLVKEGAAVKIIMTAASSSFITPLTLSTLSKGPVYQNFVKNDAGEWNSHVDLGLWADLMVIAPASAQTIAKMAHGLCDNLLTAVYLSARCPVMVAPAMDLDMYAHPATKNNLNFLVKSGNRIIDADFGELASGLTGSGRMAEPEAILSKIRGFFRDQQSLKGKSVLITAGPTWEPFDPVRFIGNHSSGKMGFALAEAAAERGARVELVCGPVSLQNQNNAIKLTRVKTGVEMLEVCRNLHSSSDLVIFSAAVADYRPKEVASHKIKKSVNEITLSLVKNPDIAFELGKNKRPDQFHVGFALESENELENAVQKLKNKNFDLVVMNSLNDPGAGFAYDTNQVTLITPDLEPVKTGLKPKKELAKEILQFVISRMK
jgi:phosphopantothenoylcysteine decarboxylase/phosphopantothenate--cysteine ligase